MTSKYELVYFWQGIAVIGNYVYTRYDSID